MRFALLVLAALSVTLGFVACGGEEGSQSPSSLRVAVTTSTRDSGLLDDIVPPFEAAEGIRVDIIAVGTGRALQLGRSGDVDVVLVHARAAEDAFMLAGHGVRREDVMYNTFELLGPPEREEVGPATDVLDALRQIPAAGAVFVSRGDSSGTHQRELSLWAAAGGRPVWDGFIESGQGMGPSLLMANEMRGYILSDRGTYLSMRRKVDLAPVTPPSPLLENPYGIMVVKADAGDRLKVAHAFVNYMISETTQRRIAAFRVDGEVLFHPQRLSRAD